MSFISTIGSVFGGIASFVKDNVIAPILGCLGGVVGGGITELINLGGNGSRLSDRTKNIMKEFFPDVDLDAVEIKTHANVPSGKKALTLSHRIHFKRGFDDCDTDDMATLMHELVHVRQYERYGWDGFMCQYGVAWVQSGYELSWMEVEAQDFTAANRGRLETRVEAACGASLVISGTNASNEAFWLIWGGHG